MRARICFACKRIRGASERLRRDAAKTRTSRTEANRATRYSVSSAPLLILSRVKHRHPSVSIPTAESTSTGQCPSFSIASSTHPTLPIVHVVLIVAEAEYF